MHPALDILREATKGTLYEGALWLVGGAVRDDLMGAPIANDFDLVLESDAVELAHFLWERKASTIAPVVYPRFGTAMVHIGDINVELVTARRESYEDTSRKPNVEPATLLEDAQRRDFTVNTLMRNLHTWALFDPLGSGLEDMQRCVLRTPLDPVATFYDDPLRMLRAVRFRWKLGFKPAPGLYEAIKSESERLRIISMERIRDEWVKMLVLPDADEAMRDLMCLGLLRIFAPEFEAMVRVEQGSYHHLDVWDHALLVLRNIGPGDLTLALAALLHDIAKPPTRFIDDEGNTRFFGHDSQGGHMARELMQRLKFSNEQIEPVELLVKNHMRLGSAKVFTPSAARKLIRDMDDHVEDLFALVAADIGGLKPGVRGMDLQPIKEKVAAARLATPRSVLESPLSGMEIMELTGLSPGPRVGELKEMLVEKVVEGELQPGDKEAAKAILLSDLHRPPR